MESKHSYNAFHKLNTFFLCFMAIVCFALGLLFLINTITFLGQGKSTSVFEAVQIFLVFSVILPFLFLFAGFLEADIYVEDSGINLKSPLRTFHVDWEDVIEVRRAS